VIARLQVLRRIGLADERGKTVHANRYGVIDREARIAHVRGQGNRLRRWGPELPADRRPGLFL
jgi:hypothetical protein